MALERFADVFPSQAIAACYVYLPQHLFLWVLLLSEIRYYKRHPSNKRRKSASELMILSLKSILNTLLIVLAVSNFGRPVTPFVVRIFEALSYFITLALLHLGEQYNVRDQTFLLSFWTLDLLVNCIRIVEQLTLGSMLYLLALALLIAYSSMTSREESVNRVEPNFIRSMCFSWFSEVSRNVHRLHLDDLGDLDADLRGEYLIKHFTEKMTTKGQYESLATIETEMHPEIKMWSLLRPFIRDLMYSGINRFALTVLFFICPFLLRQILRSDLQPNTTDSHFYVISIFIVSLVIAALNGQYLYDTQKIGLKIKSILMILIYHKSLKLKTPSGTDITLLTLDSSRFVDLLPNLHLIWSGPLIIVISIVGLLTILGRSAWIGVAVMTATIYLTKLITNKLQLLQKELMNRKDSRISSTNETVGMMKQIKFFCWEDFFQSRILQYRQNELQILKKIIYWDAPKYLLGVISPFLVSLSTFGLMILIGDSNMLTLEAVFVSIALFNILKYPLSVLPTLSSTWTSTRASVDRINQFLKADQIQQLPNLKQTNQTTVRTRHISETFEEVLVACQRAFDPSMVSVKNLTLHHEGSIILEKVDLQVIDGSFVAITGPVGCGKSSLLAAILGELGHTAGEVNTRGYIAYVSQEPWILHRSIKDNVLFGKPLDQAFYEKVIQACALRSDLETFPNGDETIIGEKGATVSGGQKQRIALARAIYQNADLYLLDDPLSSVDGEVSDYIYSKVFDREGLLSKKTVVMITQDHGHFKHADCIVEMAKGRITERHTFESFKAMHPDVENAKRNGTRIDDCISAHGIDNPQPAQAPISRDTTHKVSPKVYLKYLIMLGAIPIALILICNISIPICDIYSTIWLAKWSLINHQSATFEDHNYLVGYSLFILVLIALLCLNNAVITLKGISVARQVHNKLLHNTIHQQMIFFDNKSSGQIMNRFSSDLDVVDSRISLHIRDFLANFTGVISILILFCFNTSFYIAIVLAVIVIAYYTLLFYHLETSRHLKRMEARSKAPIILHFNESREGRSTIRAFRREDQFFREFLTILDRHQHYSYLYLASSRWLGIRLEIIGAIVIYFVTMLAVHNQDTIGASSVGVSISYALRLIPLLNALIRMTALLEENATSLERIDNYLSEKNELSIVQNQNHHSQGWPNQGKITFDGFSMEYGEHIVALKDITLTINEQEKIGIIGRTGAGKSSLISALFRLYPTHTKGMIVIDGISIDNISIRKLRRSLTIIPQSPLLFSGTIRENLDPCKEQPNDSELWNALDSCNMKQLVRSLPNRLDTVIDERGANLSVGQKQLLCLARGILRKSKIVILDEATSTMDAETERTIQQVFFSAFRDCTVLMIAHRINTIQQVDRVLCLRQGRVVKFDERNRVDDQDLMEL
ncbi:multidrug resistance-associated protein 1-like [Ochlerotatus camptorhynchus]|uniref:multidrug resistance-associated protein 1-like n=1 Tax=Ochlerotatus camptorhynchus TaxID=644619 RepID=UPI0031D0BEED